MLTAYELGCWLVKQADDDYANVFEGSKKTVDHLGPKNKSLRVPTLNRQQAQSIVDAMASATKYDALKDVRVGLGANKLKNYGQRLHDNPRVWNIIKAVNPKDSESPLGPFDPQQMGDFYLYRSNDINLPSKNPGVLVHELGHAVDFGEHPADSYTRGLIGGTYRRFAPTLWKEHAAWNKGQDRFIRGAANKKLDPKFVQDVLQSIKQYKPVGLGSYWGMALGGIGGGSLGAGLAQALGSQRPTTTALAGYGGRLLGGVLGAGAGILAGSYLGHSSARTSDKERQAHLNTYASALAKKYDMTQEEAMQEIQNMLAKTTAKKKLAA